MSILEVNNVSKSFGGVKANVDISMSVEKGKIVGLIGPNGSGKTTLFNSIVGTYPIDQGSIKFNDDIVNFTNNKKNDIFRAKNIGIVYQQNNLLPDFTALENVYLANLSINNNKDMAMTKAKDLLKRIGLSNRLNHFPSQLSGGECQRVAIARAIINDPDIILADEPTGSLDLDTAKEIFQLLNNQKKPNRLIIFATHNRFFANKADCLLEMINGSVKTINA